MSKTISKKTKKTRPPAKTLEGREQQVARYAVDLAEQQILDGTASSQIICHYLKLASSKNKLENEKLRQENKLLKAKTEAIEESKNLSALYQEAIDAMRVYNGLEFEDE